jgi:hypothetical protein
MRRWVAAAVAVLFLATATLHVLAHHGDADAGCAACQVQGSSLPCAPAPAIAAVPIPCVTLSESAAPRLVWERPAASAARAPPVLSA